MKFGNYIHDLLFEHETVIIPGFGAFISNYKPAEIDFKSNKILPPSKVISFTEKIRNNDGLLVGHIAESEGISHFDALKKIEKERENIIYKLDKGEKVTLKNTGVLLFDEKHKIQFEPFHDDNLLLDSFGLEATSMKKTIEEDLKQKDVEENDETKTAIARQPIINTEPKKPELKPVAKNETESVAGSGSEPEKEKKRGWLWYFLILIPIIIAGIFIITKEINTRKKGSEIMQKSNREAVIEQNKKSISPIDSLQKDPTQNITADSAQIIDTEIDKTEIAKPDLPKYYLVGGSFKAEKNAENFLQQLQKDGYKAFRLGKRGNFYIIGIDTYNTEKEALEAKKIFLMKKPGAGIWIYKKEPENPDNPR